MKIKALVNTVIKQQPEDSSSLADDAKFNLLEGETVAIKGSSSATAGNLRMILETPINGVKEWFAYRRHVAIDGSPGFGLLGTDTLGCVSNVGVVGMASQLLGGVKPNYWGRYFSGVDYRGAGEYLRSVESRTLHDNSIRVLPIGRYTTQVGRGHTEGARDGFDQANDLVRSFGEAYLESQGSEFYLFLDVEPDTPLSAAYYKGWSEAVAGISRRVSILPCVYLNPNDATTQASLQSALANGASCHGLWIASYVASRRGSLPLPAPDFDFGLAARLEATGVPVLFWQFAGDIGPGEDFDFTISNPQIPSDQILSRLILPPEA